MLITFITVLAWIMFLAITGHIALIFYVFVNLTPWEQNKAKITIPWQTVCIWIVSLAWIITSAMS